LALLVLWVLADDANNALTLDYLALVANLLNRSSDFHCIPLLRPLPVSIQNPPTRQVVRRQLHQHTVSREDLDVMHTDLPRNVSQQLMAAVKTNLEHGVGKILHHNTLNLNSRFLFRLLVFDFARR
jgi:hypothetical protein